jgi:hypothetical protein
MQNGGRVSKAAERRTGAWMGIRIGMGMGEAYMHTLISPIE